MEAPRNHDKKNGKTMPLAINIGAGAGIGGVVLVGGSLVTATLVSAFARRRRQSSPENISNSRSSSPETQTVDASNQRESLPLNEQKPSNDEETSMEEIQIKNIQNLTLDEKNNSGIDIAEQENTPISVDSVSEQVLDCEEQVVMAANIESAPPSSDDDDSGSEIIDRGDDGEEQKNSMPIDNVNDEHVDTKLLIPDESVTSIEKHYGAEVGIREEQSMATDITPEAEHDQVPLKDDKMAIKDDKILIEDDKIAIENDKMQIKYDKIPIEHVGEGQEAEEVASVNHVDVEDDPPLQFPKKEEIQAEIKESVDEEDQTTEKEDNPPTQLMNKEEHKDTEEIITEDKLVTKDEIPHVKSIEKDEVSEKVYGRSKTELSSDESDDEEGTKEAKMSKQKSQGDMEQIQKSVPRKQRRSSITEKLKNTWRKKDEVSEKVYGRSKTEVSSDESDDEEGTKEAKMSKQKSQGGMEQNQTSIPRKQRRSSITGKLKNTWTKIQLL